jgi:RimJ/RimL family protein N-acetyltransferase
MHHTFVFANPGYAIFVVYEGQELVHYSGIYPGYFRFPFMAKKDLQIGNTWTHPDHRGRGIAGFAISKILELERAPSRTIWYLTEDENLASVRAAEDAGMILRGYGVRTKRLGLGLLGSFVLTEPSGSGSS